MPALEPSLLTHGGPIMWVLFGLGLLLVVVFAERTLYLHRCQIRSTAFLSGIKNILAKRRLVEALTVCEETPGPVAAVVKAALLHADDDPEAMRFHVQEAAVVELPALERRIGAGGAIAQVAPLLGLLGTEHSRSTSVRLLCSAILSNTKPPGTATSTNSPECRFTSGTRNVLARSA